MIVIIILWHYIVYTNLERTSKLGVPKPVTGSQPGAALNPVSPQHPCYEIKLKIFPKFIYINESHTWLFPSVTSKKAVGLAA